MISWIVATNNRGVLDRNLRSSLVLVDDDELVVVDDGPSIAVAYNEGKRRARNGIHCYVHHDVEVRSPGRLRQALIDHCGPYVGMVGVVGCRDMVAPFWEGDLCGSVWDAQRGPLDYSPGGEPCAYLDGLLLATAWDVTWDESYPGWHWYDHDMCQRMLAAGLPNFCLPGGRHLVGHNTTGGTDPAKLPGWGAGMARFRANWAPEKAGSVGPE